MGATGEYANLTCKKVDENNIIAKNTITLEKDVTLDVTVGGDPNLFTGYAMLKTPGAPPKEMDILFAPGLGKELGGTTVEIGKKNLQECQRRLKPSI